eukprot:8040084-Prorocentrum_lima.AAC.1
MGWGRWALRRRERVGVVEDSTPLQQCPSPGCTWLLALLAPGLLVPEVGEHVLHVGCLGQGEQPLNIRQHQAALLSLLVPERTGL